MKKNQLQQSITKPHKTKYRKVGPYLLLHPIGNGSYSTVYQGKMEFQKKKLAIKQISLSNIKNKSLQRIQLEIRILSLIKHENIVQLLDHKKTARHLYLIFQHCEHTDLQKYIKEYYNGKVPQEIVRKIFIQIKKAFQVLRQNKIVHRDLKLANLLVTQDFKIKVADFGFANLLEDNKLFKSHVGTPLTMAPQILNKKDYNQKCDIWSLGIILYQMLMGKTPFVSNDNMTLGALRQGINNKNIEFDEEIPISENVIDLIKKMIVKDPEKRMNFEQFFNHKWLKETQKINLKLDLRNVILEKQLHSYFVKDKQIIQMRQYLDKILVIKLYNYLKSYIENKLFSYISLTKKLINVLQLQSNNLNLRKIVFLSLLMIAKNIEKISNQQIRISVNDHNVFFPNYNILKNIKHRQESQFSKGLPFMLNKTSGNIKEVLIKLKSQIQLCQQHIQNELVIQKMILILISYMGQVLKKVNKQLVINIIKLRQFECTMKIVLSSIYLNKQIISILNREVTWEQLSNISTIVDDDSTWKIYKQKQRLFKFDHKLQEIQSQNKKLDNLCEYIKQCF